jgi:hypothetical protein
MKIKLTLLSLFIITLCFSVKVKAQSQNCLSFDGIDDYVSATAASSLISGSNQISLTCWVDPFNASPAYPNFDGFAGIRNDTTADFYMVQTGPNQLEARFRNSAGTTYTINYFGLQVNTWQHYAFTYDGIMIRLYKNGFAVDSLAASGSISDPAVDFLVGNVRYTGADFLLTGNIDEVSFWNNTLLPQDVFCIYRSEIDTLASGLQLYYKCNQGIAGGNNTSQLSLHDASNHIDGTFQFFALTGNTSNFVSGISNYTLLTDSICNGDQYTFGSQVLTSAGVYFNTVPASQGCDSTIQLTLSLINPDTAVSQNGVTLTSQQAGAAYQWVDCGNGFSLIPGATLSSYTASVNGSYAVIVTHSGCTDTSGCHQVTGVGIAEHGDLSGMVLYPSVAGNEITVTTGKLNKDIHLTITDVTGKKIVERDYAVFKNEMLDVSGFHSGVYFLTIQSGAEKTVRQFVKK